MNQLFFGIKENYLEGYSILALSNKFQISRSKVKKILITQHIYPDEISRTINNYLNSNISKDDICRKCNISSSFLNENLPYTKCIYNQVKRSKIAIRLERYHIKEALAKERINRLRKERNSENIHNNR